MDTINHVLQQKNADLSGCISQFIVITSALNHAPNLRVIITLQTSAYSLYLDPVVSCDSTRSWQNFSCAFPEFNCIQYLFRPLLVFWPWFNLSFWDAVFILGTFECSWILSLCSETCCLKSSFLLSYLYYCFLLVHFIRACSTLSCKKLDSREF